MYFDAGGVRMQVAARPCHAQSDLMHKESMEDLQLS